MDLHASEHAHESKRMVLLIEGDTAVGHTLASWLLCIVLAYYFASTQYRLQKLSARHSTFFRCPPPSSMRRSNVFR